MEYQIVNEISQFWRILVPPIFLGTISIVLFLWIIGKEYRSSIMKRFIKNDMSGYVCQNGIYIRKDQTIRYIFIQKLISRLGLESIKPLMSIFLITLLFFGLHQLLIMIFQPMLTTSARGALYASGIGDYCMAYIWSHYPNVQSSSSLYGLICASTDDAIKSTDIFIYSIESYIRFNIFAYLLVAIYLLFYRAKRTTKKIFKRVFMLIILLFFSLVVTLTVQIQNKNKEIRHRCNIVFSNMIEEDEKTGIDRDLQDQMIDQYLELIKTEKAKLGDAVYFGAYGVHTRVTEFFTELFREGYRLIITYREGSV